MSRQEDFKNKRNEYVDSYCYENEITSAEMVDAIDETFDDATDYGYQYAVEKAMVVLRDDIFVSDDIIELFRRVMEE